MKMLQKLGISLLALLALAGLASAQKWTPVNNLRNIGPGAMALLTDGRVIIHDESGNSGTWE